MWWSAYILSAPTKSRGMALSVFWRNENESFLPKLWRQDEGQGIAEYGVILAVILVLVVGTIRLVGSHSNSVFSNAASSIQ